MGMFKLAKYSLTNKKYVAFKLTGLDEINHMTWDSESDIFYFTDGSKVRSVKSKQRNKSFPVTCSFQKLSVMDEYPITPPSLPR